MNHKFYSSMQSLPVSTYKWKNLCIGFVTKLPKSKDWRDVKYNSKLVIVDQLMKIEYYEPVFTTLNAQQLAKVLIEAVIKYHSLPDSIVTKRGSLFISKVLVISLFFF